MEKIFLFLLHVLSFSGLFSLKALSPQCLAIDDSPIVISVVILRVSVVLISNGSSSERDRMIETIVDVLMESCLLRRIWVPVVYC